MSKRVTTSAPRTGLPPLVSASENAFGTAALDFVTLTDYVTNSAWGEVGRYQPAHKGRLIARSSEVITYRGHTNNQVSERYVDYRTGPIYVRGADGALQRAREPRPPARGIFPSVHAGGGRSPAAGRPPPAARH